MKLLVLSPTECRTLFILLFLAIFCTSLFLSGGKSFLRKQEMAKKQSYRLKEKDLNKKIAVALIKINDPQILGSSYKVARLN